MTPKADPVKKPTQVFGHRWLPGLLALALTSAECLGQGGAITNGESGTPASGASLAGQAALARDASTVYLNPAGMSRLARDQFLVSAGASYFQARFAPSSASNPGGGGGNAGGWLPAGALFYSQRLTDHWHAGLSVVAPVGNALNYESNWSGRYVIRDAELTVVDIQPAVSMRHGKWSWGAGVNIQRADVRQSFAIDQSPMADLNAEIEADGWGVGFSLGAMYEPSEDTRIGVKYRSQVHHKVEGDLTTDGGSTNSPATIRFDLPSAVNLSAYQNLDERWSLFGGVGWTDWSDFEPVDLRDSWRGALGVHYRPNSKWFLQAGISRDSAASRLSTRTPIVPADDQWRYSVGVERPANQDVTLGFAYTYVDFGKAAIDIDPDASGGQLEGDYSELDLHGFLLYLRYDF